MSILIFCAFAIVTFMIVLLPVKIAAGWMGAERTDFVSCFLAVVVAIIINVIANSFIRYGAVASIFVAAIAYQLVLGTTYLRAIAIEILSVVILYVMAIVLIATAIAPDVLKGFGFVGH